MKWIVKDVKRLFDGGVDWRIVWACIICWSIYGIPLALGIALEGVLPRHWVAG